MAKVSVSKSKKKTNKTDKTEKKKSVQKNSSHILHSVQKIQGNEKKYTSILVVIFMIIFVIIGYYSLSVHNGSLLNNINNISNHYFDFSSFGQVITLTNDHIVSDESGLKSDSYPLTIRNSSSRNMNYRVIFVPDEGTIKNCGCQDRKAMFTAIRYSLDGKQVLSFTDESMVIWQGFLGKEEEEKLSIKLWFDSGLDRSSDYHFHGNFLVEEI